MTNNQLTDERIEQIAVWLATESHSLNLETLTCLRELQERRKADSEPVAWTDTEELRDVNVAGIGYLFGIDREANKFADPRRQIMLYRHAQPAPVVPDAATAIRACLSEFPESVRDIVEECADIAENACRAAMLQAGNSPVILDRWITVSERLPNKNQSVLVLVDFDSSFVEPLICTARFTGSTFRRSDATIKPGAGVERVTYWMPLPAAPQGVPGD